MSIVTKINVIIILCGEINKEFNKTYRFSTAHTEQEIGDILQKTYFCVDKTNFLRPGYKLC